MRIQIDTREHKSELKRIEQQFDALGVDYFKSKLYVGDYMNMDNPHLVIDRKKDLGELCGNVCQQHERFRKELERAMENEIRIIILCEHGEGIERLSDVHFWKNPRADISEWVMEDGHPVKRLKYPKAVQGESLYKSLCTIRDKYNVEFRFCDKSETGYMIMKLLEVEDGR